MTMKYLVLFAIITLSGQNERFYIFNKNFNRILSIIRFNPGYDDLTTTFDDSNDVVSPFVDTNFMACDNNINRRLYLIFKNKTLVGNLDGLDRFELCLYSDSGVRTKKLFFDGLRGTFSMITNSQTNILHNHYQSIYGNLSNLDLNNPKVTLKQL